MADINPMLEADELHTLLRLVDAEQSRADLLMRVVIPIGVALAYETDWNRLMERIVGDAMGLCHADGGTLYLVDPDTRGLKPVIVRVDSLNLSIGSACGAGGGEPSQQPARAGSVPEECARLGAVVNVPDVLAHSTGACAEAAAFDQHYGYHTISCLAVPLRGSTGDVIGVVKLINASRPGDRQISPFEPGTQQIVESLCSLAGAAVENYLRQQKLKDHVRELTIQIDESRKGRQVSAIVQSEYFKSLQGRARELRGTIDQK